MAKEKFIVLDVEGMSGLMPYNVGYVIADRYGKIYKERSFALPENIYINIVRSAKLNQAVEMTAGNVTDILQDFKNPFFKRKYKCVGNEEFKKRLLKDIKKNNIKKIYAYNVAFDKASLKNLFGDDFEKLEVEFIDIIPIILRTKLLTKKYCQFCIDNGYVTEKGNIMTKAEIVYRYLFNDLTFVEEHTGLADVKIEYKILLKAFQTHKKIDSTPCMAWKVLANFCKENNLTIATA